MRSSFFRRLLVACVKSGRIAWTLFREHGMFSSLLSRKGIDAKGNPVPWFTYPAIEYLKQFDFSDKTIFEYGSGNSSFFWATRAKNVVSVESGIEWFGYISELCPPNLNVFFEPTKEGYVSSIARQGCKFDLIVIDGQWRNACAAICPDFLAEYGMIVIDNSDRQYPGSDELRARGFFQIDFSGFSPINEYTSTTSIFIKAPNSLQKGFTQPEPVGCLRQRAALDD